tara:strand:- start:1952 stop:2131 length:180 start_codon:yes stop_codon:yes gene_type:complete
MQNYFKKYLKYKKKYITIKLLNSKYKVNKNLSFYQKELLNFRVDKKKLLDYNVITLLDK